MLLLWHRVIRPGPVVRIRLTVAVSVLLLWTMLRLCVVTTVVVLFLLVYTVVKILPVIPFGMCLFDSLVSRLVSVMVLMCDVVTDRFLVPSVVVSLLVT